MDKLTFKQAEEKIFQAYFRNEIKILDPEFCFCGTLSPDSNWYVDKRWLTPAETNVQYPYKRREYALMEQALFSAFPEHGWAAIGLIDEYANGFFGNPFDDLTYEEKLFNGMCAALEVLKQIHRDRGEIIDEPVPFKQRKLVTV